MEEYNNLIKKLKPIKSFLMSVPVINLEDQILMELDNDVKELTGTPRWHVFYTRRMLGYGICGDSMINSLAVSGGLSQDFDTLLMYPYFLRELGAYIGTCKEALTSDIYNSIMEHCHVISNYIECPQVADGLSKHSADVIDGILQKMPLCRLKEEIIAACVLYKNKRFLVKKHAATSSYRLNANITNMKDAELYSFSKSLPPAEMCVYDFIDTTALITLNPRTTVSELKKLLDGRNVFDIIHAGFIWLLLERTIDNIELSEFIIDDLSKEHKIKSTDFKPMSIDTSDITYRYSHNEGAIYFIYQAIKDA